MSTATELLRRALEHLEWCDEGCCDEPLEEAIRAFLAAEPEAEPVRYMVVNEQGETSFLYTRPEQSRKPMAEREIMEQARVDGFNAIDTAVFAIGVRWAERMHRIGGDDE